MKRYYSILCITVLCTLLLCACAATDAQMDPGKDTNTQQTDASNSETAPFTSEETASVQTEPAETIPANAVPYTLSLGSTVPIYSGPSYDYSYVQVVGQDGIYTIVEETQDEEGNLWGELKSGAGWVDLTYVRSSGTDKAPITASFADDALLSSGNYHEHIVDQSEYMVKIAFRASEPLSNVNFTSLQLNGDSYEATETLFTLDTLSSETPFVAGVVYYGDMTTYGISFTDSTGATRYYAVYISSRNGALILDEYNP